MINFDDSIQRIKEVLTHEAHNEKVLDKDIAKALKLNPQYFAVIKKRKKVPYEAISYFSKHNKLNMNWILLAQKPQYLT